MKRAWLTAVVFGALVAFAEPSSTDPSVLEAQLKQNPSDLPTRIALGRAYLEAGRYEDAARLFEDVLALDYNNFAAHFGLGLAHYRQGNLKAARFEFEQLTRLYPERFEGWYNLAVVHAQEADWEAATEAFTRAIELGEASDLATVELKQAYLGLAEAHRKQGRPDQAAEILKRALARFEGDLELTYLLAENLVLAGDALEAIPHLYSILQKDRGHVAAVSLLADIYVGQGLGDRALRELDRSLAQVTEPHTKAQLLLKKALLLQGTQPNKSRELLEQAVNLDPNLWQAHYNLGVAWLKARDPDRAMQSFRLAYRLRPNEPRVLLGMAVAADQLGEPSEALRFAQLAAALAEDKAKVEALVLVGKSAYQLGRYDAALEALDQAIALDDQNGQAWLWLGLAAYATRDFSRAVEALERAVALEGSLTARMNLGAAYLAVKRFSDAERVLTQVVLEDADNAEAWYNLGWALKALARDQEALRAWKKALELGYEPARGLVN